MSKFSWSTTWWARQRLAFCGDMQAPSSVRHSATTAAGWQLRASDGTVRIWDLESGRGLLLIRACLSNEAMALTFSQDGRRLVGASGNGSDRARSGSGT